MNHIGKVSPDFAKLNPGIFGNNGMIAPIDGTDTKPTKADVKMEKELQAICRQWLMQRGYIELTGANAEIHAPVNTVGWFGHLAKPRGNAFMPDLFIFNPPMTHCLMVELKVRKVYQPGQREMINADVWREVTTWHEFRAVLENFEWGQM